MNESYIFLKRFHDRFLRDRARWIRADVSGTCLVVCVVGSLEVGAYVCVCQKDTKDGKYYNEKLVFFK